MASVQEHDMDHLIGREMIEKKRLPEDEVENSLRHEIMQLEKKLQEQIAVRGTLEKALGYETSALLNTTAEDVSIPKPTADLIEDIAVLELEVVRLEKYLLSLYRKAFDKQISTLSPSTTESQSTAPMDNHLNTLSTNPKQEKESRSAVYCSESVPNKRNDSGGRLEEYSSLDSAVDRCHSTLSVRSPLSTTSSPRSETKGRVLRSFHSQPLSMVEYAQSTSSNAVSLAEHLSTCVSDKFSQTPNKISEDMIKYMSAVYSKLAEHHRANLGLSSPTPSSASTFAFSPKDHSRTWSPGFNRDSLLFDVVLDNTFHVQGLQEFSGPYSKMIQVKYINRDNLKSSDVDYMLQTFRSLISRLKEIDPGKMKHEEKLAFWINIHNALVMHALLVYGVSQNNVKRIYLLLKAAYNIGGHIVTAELIQCSILGCRRSRPGQWLRFLFSSRTKFKQGDERLAYAIDHPEPLLHFALCLGSHSDPAIRLYTPERVSKDLEVAKEEFLQASFALRKDQKILLPKIVESFAKDSNLCHADVIDMVQHCLPDESPGEGIKKPQPAKYQKSIEWIPHNFAFRCLISKELVG